MVFKKIVGVLQILFSLVLFSLAIYLGLLKTTIMDMLSSFLDNVPQGLIGGNLPDVSAINYGILVIAIFIGVSGIMFLLQGIVNLLNETSSVTKSVNKSSYKALPIKPKRNIRRSRNIVRGGNLGNQY